MKPRDAQLVLALGLVAPPITSSGQQPGKVYRIGWAWGECSSSCYRYNPPRRSVQGREAGAHDGLDEDH
jgi:hypothetical protein